MLSNNVTKLAQPFLSEVASYAQNPSTTRPFLSSIGYTLVSFMPAVLRTIHDLRRVEKTIVNNRDGG